MFSIELYDRGGSRTCMVLRKFDLKQVTAADQVIGVPGIASALLG